jgi:isopenicillin N synthase-like dioxygenase
MEAHMLWFFHLPLEEKLKVKRNATNPRGFAHDELTKQLPDYKEILDFGFGFGALDGVNHLPDAPEFIAVLREYYKACAVLSQTLVDLLAESLEIDKTVFSHAFQRHSSFARLNYYPPYVVEGEIPPMGISRHTDAGALTVLWQESPGLQVYSGTKQVSNIQFLCY